MASGSEDLATRHIQNSILHIGPDIPRLKASDRGIWPIRACFCLILESTSLKELCKTVGLPEKVFVGEWIVADLEQHGTADCIASSLLA